MEDWAFFDNLPSKLELNSLSIGQKKMIQIVEGAIQVIVKIGIEQATYTKIAQASKVSRPLIQHYFPSKKQLIEASFKYLKSTFLNLDIQNIKQKILGCETAKESIIEYISMHFELAKQKNSAYMQMGFLFFHYSGVDSRIKASNSYHVKQGTQRIKEILEKGIVDGSFHVLEYETEKLARMIQLILIGALTACATEIQENLINIQQDVINTVLKLLKVDN